MKYELGYYFTSWENWQKIKKEGLVPQDLRDTSLFKVKELVDFIERYKVHGVFLFCNPLVGKSLASQVWYVATKKLSSLVVSVEVRYKPEDMEIDMPTYNFVSAYTISGNHDMGTSKEPDFPFWQDREPFVVVTKRIPQRRLRLLKQWNLEELIHY